MKNGVLSFIILSCLYQLKLYLIKYLWSGKIVSGNPHINFNLEKILLETIEKALDITPGIVIYEYKMFYL